ncbi:uncharacterized protein BX664DRAFT_360548 [Halteromyces radiatus]|uniref:uncharacterized protein n=1 Tax=Halteromyces radiatus TaxID=101107 RepID=UPI0022205140|nr:uncharacterized protein BX664DRAFT_360548 [Halteromyces radiatus]KAI8084713.1 hypothetical protein BX664DRAFT_360548 [Halteromyces radiatus]
MSSNHSHHNPSCNKRSYSIVVIHICCIPFAILFTLGVFELLLDNFPCHKVFVKRTTILVSALAYVLVLYPLMAFVVTKVLGPIQNNNNNNSLSNTHPKMASVVTIMCSVAIYSLSEGIIYFFQLDSYAGFIHTIVGGLLGWFIFTPITKSVTAKAAGCQEKQLAS